MKLKKIISLLVFTVLPLVSHAFSAVAVVDGHASESIYASWNYGTQKEADSNAIEGCRVSARNSGISDLAKNCGIRLRQKSAGAGAMVCGQGGCGYVAGYETEQGAVDAAHDECARRYKDCQKTGITGWWDDAGYRKQVAKNSRAVKTCNPPTGEAVRSSTVCDNGDCVRKFENGCQVKFQAPYCNDPITGNWEWKSDGC
jgi:hypothetical protein